MEIRKLIDDFGDDIYALALISTKDFNSAKEIFVRMTAEYGIYPDNIALYDLLLKEYPLCREADSNDSAVTLTGVELDAKKQALLEVLLQKPFIVRSIIHLHWENDLEPEQIAKVTGESVKYVNSVLGELSDSLAEALDKRYKDICVKITADDKLKSYVIRSASSGKKRHFEVKEDAVPTHKWTKKQKIVVIIIAAVMTVLVCIVVPILESYYEMRKREEFSSFENVPTDEIFSYTLEVGSETDSSGIL